MSERQELLLIISEDRVFTARLKAIFAREGWEYNIASQPCEMSDILGCSNVALIIIDMQGGTELRLALVRETKNRYPYLPIITVAGVGEIDAAVGSLRYGAYDYVIKPLFSDEVIHNIKKALEKRRLELRLRKLEGGFNTQLGKNCEEMALTMKRTLAAVSLTLEAGDSYTAGHSRKVSAIATAIGKKMGLDGEQLDDIRWGSLIHDIGKIAIDRRIINKPSKLTEEEYVHIMTHPLVGASIVGQAIGNRNILDIIEYHHCLYNGNGYGQTVKGENIPLLARIIGVADAYEAMTSLRPYRQALSRKEAIAEIINHTDRQFDPIVVSAFLKLSVSDMASDRDKVMVVRDDQTGKLLLKSVLFNKYARSEWIQDLCR